MNTPKPPWDDERPAASAFEVRRKQSTQEKGQNAEDAVAKWLQDHQYVILARNWRWHRFEWQSRTSIHAHGAARFSNDPGLIELT